MKLNDLKYAKHPSNYLLFFKVFYGLLHLRRLLQKTSFADIFGQLDALPKVSVDAARIEAMIKFNDFIIHRLFRSDNPCMLRSLFLYRCLKTLPMELKIAFGVRRQETALVGHAWLIKNGSYFLEFSDPEKIYRKMHVYP